MKSLFSGCIWCFGPRKSDPAFLPYQPPQDILSVLLKSETLSSTIKSYCCFTKHCKLEHFLPHCQAFLCIPDSKERKKCTCWHCNWVLVGSNQQQFVGSMPHSSSDLDSIQACSAGSVEFSYSPLVCMDFADHTSFSPHCQGCSLRG